MEAELGTQLMEEGAGLYCGCLSLFHSIPHSIPNLTLFHSREILEFLRAHDKTAKEIAGRFVK